MPTPPGILNKVKFLLNLSTSSNANEAAAAKSAADKLIIKFNITDDELERMDPKPLYGDNELLYHTFSIVGWMNRLALAIAKHFDCYIVQETLTAATGATEYNYFVYGGSEEEEYVKFCFATFHKKIHYLLDTKCIGRGPIYQNSYCEGVVEAIKENIEYDGIDLPTAKAPSRTPAVVQEKNILNNGGSNLAVPKGEKERPHQESIDVSKQSLIKDVNAYYKGVMDGQHLSLSDILELEVENEEAARLGLPTTET
jgi:hypothetical protein